MAVVYDSSAVSSSIDFTVTAITSFNITIGSGSNRAAILWLLMFDNIDHGTISVDIGGVAGSLITGADTGTGQSSIRMRAFKILNPGTGVKAVHASWPTGAISVICGVIAVSGCSDVGNGAQFNTFGTSTGGAITSASGDLTASACGNNQTATSMSTNQTEKYANGVVFKGDIGPGTANPTHTWTVNANDNLVMAGANFIAAGGGPPPVIPVTIMPPYLPY